MEVKNKMSNITAKTASNVFYKARCEAAAHNERQEITILIVH